MFGFHILRTRKLKQNLIRAFARGRELGSTEASIQTARAILDRIRENKTDLDIEDLIEVIGDYIDDISATRLQILQLLRAKNGSGDYERFMSIDIEGVPVSFVVYSFEKIMEADEQWRTEIES